MKKYASVVLMMILSGGVMAQLTSSDIRQASGKGPYPIYITGQTILGRSNNLFSDFVTAYSTQYDMPNKKYFNGLEGSMGIVINDQHFLGLKGWKVRGFAVEIGYRSLFQNINNDEHTRQLFIQEELVSFRIGKRFNILYPLTLQVQAGPTFYNFYTVRESTKSNGITTSTLVRYGSRLFQGKTQSQQKFIPGLDTRIRFAFFDPAGTAGGLGFYLEYTYIHTFAKRDLQDLYKTFFDRIESDPQTWEYGSLTLGLVVPLALRVVSFQ